MSYGVAASLQEGIYGCLASDPQVVALVGDAVFDAVPAGAVPPVYVSLGPESVSDASDKSCDGALHRFTVSVVSESAGFLEAKKVAAAISDALGDAAPTLERGRIVRLQFRKASARRVGTGTRRRIDLQFEARVEDN